MVLLPAGTPLPPSRGRTTFEFRNGGVFEELAPGATDAAQAATGRWSLDHDTLRLSYDDDRPDRTFDVRTGGGKLVLSRK
jgi:hypothetical protein